MRSTFLIGLIAACVLATTYAFTVSPRDAVAAGGKNLKVYPKGTDKKAIKKDMKAMAKALGVSCEHCHDLSAMEKDTKPKEKARDMMRLVKTINGTMKKDGFKGSVSCLTCHGGKLTPPN